MIVGDEECDDNNTNGNDGCSAFCSVERVSSLSAGAIAAIVGSVSFVICLLTILLGLLAFLLIRKKRVKSAVKAQLGDRIPVLDDVEVGEVIGSGAFGQGRFIFFSIWIFFNHKTYILRAVFKGKWKNTAVALKTVHAEDLTEVVNEINVMIELRHPNVLQLFGLYYRSETPMIVTEYMEKGDLTSFLRSEAELEDFHLLSFCKQTAIGMEYLHSRDILHRDLACRNLLCSKGKKNSYIIKISDFGLSRKGEEYYKSASKKIPVRWTAPEAIGFGTTYKSSDVPFVAF